MGCDGYISFLIKTPGKEWVVCCAFNSKYSGGNRVAVQIRGSDGVTDTLGRHESGTAFVTPTGTIADLN